MAQRISRAKQRIRDAGARFELPATGRAGRAARRGPARALPGLQRGLHRQLRAGPAPHRPDRRGDPPHPAAAPPAARRGRGRRAARVDAAHRRPPRRPHRRRRVRSCRSPSSDRDLWDAAAIAEGQALLTRTLGTGPVGPYQIQAAIAALHDEAPTAERHRLAADPRPVRRPRPGRARTGGHAQPRRRLAMVHGPDRRPRRCSAPSTPTTGWPTPTASKPSARTCSNRPATRHAARESYLRAARMTASLPEQRYLTLRAASLSRPAAGHRPGRELRNGSDHMIYRCLGGVTIHLPRQT